MNVTRILKILLVAEIVVLLGFAVVNFRDYQDTWILEGLEIPFAILTATYGVYVFAERDIKRLLLFSLLFRSVWLVLPQLKYAWFQGVAIDQQMHYRLAKDIQDIGFIPSGRYYSDTPLMQVLFATYSLVTGVSMVDAFKYLPILWWGAYPLLIYVLVKKSQLGKNNSSILKYAVVIACIPSKPTLTYVVVGTLFGAFLVFLFLYQLVGILRTNAWQYWILGVICSLALVSAHAYSSTELLTVLLITFFVSTVIIKSFRFRYLKTTLLIFLAVLNIAWLLYQAPTLYGSARHVILTFLRTVQGLRTTPSTTGFRPRLFQLGTLNSSRVLAVFHGADLFVLFLMMLGILFATKKLRSSTLFRFFSVYVASAWMLYAIQLLFGRGIAGVVEYNRVFEHTLIASPILAGVALFYLEKKMRSLVPVIVTVSLLMILAPIELFVCQPLIPSSRTISEDLPSSEPVVWVGMVNSIYQRSLIQHAENYIEKGFIASDPVGNDQTIGLASYNFSKTNVMGYYPFSTLIDNTTKKRGYDYFFIRFAGRGGVIQEPAEIRTTSLIQTAIYSSSVTYNNGESYILQSPFMYEDG